MVGIIGNILLKLYTTFPLEYDHLDSPVNEDPILNHSVISLISILFGINDVGLITYHFLRLFGAVNSLDNPLHEASYSIALSHSSAPKGTHLL